MDPIILFNHIPKTGGTTLRILLNKVYGTENVFFPNSKDLTGSYKKYAEFSSKKKSSYKVIAGHATYYYANLTNIQYRITILREPLSLFLSQYQYLKTSSNSIFRDDIKQLDGIEEYIEFAKINGQDNLMTRYLSESVNWLLGLDPVIPDMDTEGDKLLEKAKENLTNYAMIMDLSAFDDDVFTLKEKLNWKHVPFYKRANKSGKPTVKYPEYLIKKLSHMLRYDLELYRYFQEEKQNLGFVGRRSGLQYYSFIYRQKCINLLY